MSNTAKLHTKILRFWNLSQEDLIYCAWIFPKIHTCSIRSGFLFYKILDKDLKMNRVLFLCFQDFESKDLGPRFPSLEFSRTRQKPICIVASRTTKTIPALLAFAAWAETNNTRNIHIVEKHAVGVQPGCHTLCVQSLIFISSLFCWSYLCRVFCFSYLVNIFL